METTDQTHTSEARGIVLMITSVLCFSATSLLLSYIHHAYGISGWVASAYRAVAGLSVVFLMQRHTGKLELQRIVTQPLLFLRGLIGGATIPVYYLCIMELGPGRAGMISGSYPLFAALFAVPFLGERLPRRYFPYIAVALIGLVAVFNNNGFGASKPFYDTLAIIGAAAGGLCVVMIRHLRHTESTSTIFASQCAFTLVIGVSMAGGDLLIADPVALALVILASITVAMGQLCITESFRYINVAKGSTLQMLTPAITVIASASILGEAFSFLEIAGGAAILFASYKIAMAKSR